MNNDSPANFFNQVERELKTRIEAGQIPQLIVVKDDWVDPFATFVRDNGFDQQVTVEAAPSFLVGYPVTIMGPKGIPDYRQRQELEAVFENCPALSDDGPPHPERFYP